MGLDIGNNFLVGFHVLSPYVKFYIIRQTAAFVRQLCLWKYSVLFSVFKLANLALRCSKTAVWYPAFSASFIALSAVALTPCRSSMLL
ncbi:MAG: hypothetical protein V8S72_01110 [Oscillospiraceae bacterium]